MADAITTWYGGWGASLTAIALGGLLSSWFFMPPRYSLAVIGMQHQVGYVTYFLGLSFICRLRTGIVAGTAESRNCDGSAPV
ncbi:MAG: DUF4118 domain-containing protein [Nitrospira sp.]|nr:DUF4118 domain-containing protein [Nitrospira sp.]